LPSPPFDRCVFVNCPFDTDFARLLRPLVFCILDLGLEPRIALERLDSGEQRVEKIIELIESSKFGIHDLSRLRAMKRGRPASMPPKAYMGHAQGRSLFSCPSGAEVALGRSCRDKLPRFVH